jgi:hypothetical protein
MSKTKITALILTVALIMVAAGGVLVYNNVSAQTPTPTTLPGKGPGQWQGRPGGPQNNTAHDTELAAALGITLDKLQAAYQTANAAALKQAVSQGLITQAQADQYSANGLPNGPMRGFGQPGSNSIDYHALLANALGITTSALQTAQQQVQAAALAAAVKSGQLTQAQADLMQARQALMGNAAFQAGMKTAYQTAIQQAVTDGVITQAQADLLLKDNAGMMGFPGGGMGGFGGRSGMRGGRGGPNGNQGSAPQNQQQNGQPTPNGL